jgi:CheY-like chemotaxis protein
MSGDRPGSDHHSLRFKSSGTTATFDDLGFGSRRSRGDLRFHLTITYHEDLGTFTLEAPAHGADVYHELSDIFTLDLQFFAPTGIAEPSIFEATLQGAVNQNGGGVVIDFGPARTFSFNNSAGSGTFDVAIDIREYGNARRLHDLVRCAVTDRVCLIVDDEPGIRRYLRTILEGERLQSLEADSAGQALRIVQSLGRRLELVISDIRMPGDMNGVDLAHSLRNAFPALPVILISGYDDQIEHGGFDFIPKPFSAERILNAVERAMDLHRPEDLHASKG